MSALSLPSEYGLKPRAELPSPSQKLAEAEAAKQGEASSTAESLPSLATKTAEPGGHPVGSAVVTKASPRPASSSGREMRRARIVITVKRTPEYAQWLLENPHSLDAAAAIEEVVETIEEEEEDKPAVSKQKASRGKK